MGELSLICSLKSETYFFFSHWEPLYQMRREMIMKASAGPKMHQIL